MKKLAHNNLYQMIHHFSCIARYLAIPANEIENQKLIAFTRELKPIIRQEKNEDAARLLNLIINNIEAYEKRAYPIKSLPSHEMLAFLMEQHELTQSDLPEIGSQPHVSKILKGERNLTKDQIGALAKRFNISPAVFYE